MKLLLGKMDRMEALMEKLIEVVYYQQESRSTIPSQERTIRTHKPDESYRVFEEEHLSDDDNMGFSDSQRPDYEVIDDCNLEEYVIEEFDDSSQPRKRFKSSIDETPKENNVNEFILPLSSTNVLETFDELVSKDQDVRDKVVTIIDSVISDEKTFRDIVRHIVTDDVLESYADNRSELKDMYLFKVLLRETYSRKRDDKHFWRRLDSLFGIPMQRRTQDGPIYETEDFRLPIKSIMELEELDRKVRVYPHIKSELTEAMKDLFLAADRNNANFLAKMIGKECLDECSWSSKSRKKNRLMDFVIFNELYPSK